MTVGNVDLVVSIHSGAAMVAEQANGQERTTPLGEDITVRGRVRQGRKWETAGVRGANDTTVG